MRKSEGNSTGEYSDEQKSSVHNDNKDLDEKDNAKDPIELLNLANDKSQKLTVDEGSSVHEGNKVLECDDFHISFPKEKCGKLAMQSPRI